MPLRVHTSADKGMLAKSKMSSNCQNLQVLADGFGKSLRVRCNPAGLSADEPFFETGNLSFVTVLGVPPITYPVAGDLCGRQLRENWTQAMTWLLPNDLS